jgi:tetratricopeptide (TPR) repeat protein
VNPEMTVAPKTIIAAGVVKDSTATKTNGALEPINAPGKELKRIDTFLIHPVVPKNPEIGYNASIGYIMDLKVTEFEKYYRKMVEVDELEFTGVSAQFDNFASEQENDGETVREVPAEQFLNEGLRAFHNGHYGKCIEKMEVLRKNNPSDLNAAFYMGVSYVKLEMYEKSIPFFDQVLNSPNNVFHEEANWYKALALIGNGNTEAAKKVLTEISQKDGFYKEKAAAKLQEL